MPRKLGLFSFKRRLKEKVVVVICDLMEGQKENRAGIFLGGDPQVGGDETVTLIATPGSQIRLWKHFFTLSANTETGAQRGCAICSLGGAQIQTTKDMFAVSSWS